MKTWRSLAAGIALFPAAMVAADTVVTVGASGATRDQAIESALGDALVEALGTHVFSVTTMTGDQFASMSTAVSGGRIKSFEVLDEIETFDGVHVQLSVELSDADVEGFAPKETVTWADRIEETHGWDHAQRTINQYRGLLDDFLRGPKHQVHAGYAFVLRSYDVDTVDSSSLSGNIYVDVIVNDSWWQTYYQIVQAITPQGSNVIAEGPIRVDGDVAGVDPSASSQVDASLRYDLAHPVPVRLGVGASSAKFILYKNALLISAQPITEDTALGDHHKEPARRGEIVMFKGNVEAGDAVIDSAKSDLSCGSLTNLDSGVYCGDRFTVKLPFVAENEGAVIRMMNQGLSVDLGLYGDACETGCPGADSVDGKMSDREILELFFESKS